MNLEEAEADRFFRVWWALLRHVNRTLRVFDDATAWRDGSYEPEYEPGLVQKFLEGPVPLVESFVREEGHVLSPEDRALAESWTRLTGGYFVLVVHERDRTILVSQLQIRTTYAVVGVRYPLSSLFPEHMLPADGLFVLFPFGDRIVARAVGVEEYPVQWDAPTRRKYQEAYRPAETGGRILTRLDEAPATASPSHRPPPRSARPRKKRAATKAKQPPAPPRSRPRSGRGRSRARKRRPPRR